MLRVENSLWEEKTKANPNVLDYFFDSSKLGKRVFFLLLVLHIFPPLASAVVFRPSSQSQAWLKQQTPARNSIKKTRFTPRFLLVITAFLLSLSFASSSAGRFAVTFAFFVSKISLRATKPELFL